MSENFYRRDIRFPPEVNNKLELLKKELEEKRGRPLSMSRLVVEIVAQFLGPDESAQFSAVCRALRKEEDNAPRRVRSQQDEGAEGG